MLILPLLAWSAHAQAEDCPSPFGINAFLEGVSQAEAELGSGKLDEAESTAETLYERAPCLRDQVHPRHLVRYGRVRAMAAYQLGLERDAHYWGQLALLDREVAWPDEIAPDAEGRAELQVMAGRLPVLLEQRGLDLPEGHGLLLDGVAVTRPRAAPAAPHLVQLINPEGRVYDTFWQDGVIWAESLLDFDPSPITIPDRYASPNPQLDPYESVALTAREFQRRKSERMEAAAAKAETETRLADALELERAAARKRRRGRPQTEPESDAPIAGAIADEPVPIYIEGDAGRPDALERRVNPELCRDLLRLEARSIVGRLTEDQLTCLRTQMATAPRQTTRARISRALLADAWAKDDHDRWEAALVRHLEQIDRSDATLSLILATWFAQPDRGEYEEAIRWAGVARENAHQWEGTLRVERLTSLHQLDTLSAAALWLDAEAAAVERRSEDAERRAGYWRDQTKTLAREWLQFALAASLDPREAFELCLSASGTADYCEIL